MQHVNTESVLRAGRCPLSTLDLNPSHHSGLAPSPGSRARSSQGLPLDPSVDSIHFVFEYFLYFLVQVTSCICMSEITITSACTSELFIAIFIWSISLFKGVRIYGDVYLVFLEICIDFHTVYTLLQYSY